MDMLLNLQPQNPELPIPELGQTEESVQAALWLAQLQWQVTAGIPAVAPTSVEENPTEAESHK